MEKIQREQLLKKLSSPQKEAVEEFLEEQIEKLNKEAVFNSQSFEEVLGSRKAIEKIKNLKNVFSQEEKPEQRNNREYK